MSKFVHHASYYLDDKDLSDLLETQNLTPRFLLKFARRRGLFLSDKASREDLIHTLCMAPISWEDVATIAEAINAEDRDTNQMAVQLTSGVDLNDLPGALDRVKAWLEGSREVPTLTKTGEHSYRLEVCFVEVQPQRTRPLQRVERHVTVEVEQVGRRLDIRHSEHAHAKQIVRRLIAEFPKQAEEKRERTVSLWSVRDPLLRIKFFTDLINCVDGFTLSEVTDLQVDRRFPEQEETVADNGSPRQSEDEIVGMVKRAVLSGERLLNSEFYYELRDSGYYIGTIKWLSNELGGDQRQVEFSAGFKDPIIAKDFVFDVRRVARREKDGSYGKAERNQPVDRPLLLKALEAAAYRAMDGLEQNPVAATAASTT